MAPFAYAQSARFSDENAGAYYAANDLQTSIEEVTFHRTAFASRTATPPMDFDERVIEADIDADFFDLRTWATDSFVYDPNISNYPRIQAFARQKRADGWNGIVYRSVRNPAGECVAVFIPRLIKNARTAGYIGLRWNGKRIVDSYRKESLSTKYP
jgi:hypothetical protein